MNNASRTNSSRDTRGIVRLAPFLFLSLSLSLSLSLAIQSANLKARSRNVSLHRRCSASLEIQFTRSGAFRHSPKATYIQPKDEQRIPSTIVAVHSIYRMINFFLNESRWNTISPHFIRTILLLDGLVLAREPSKRGNFSALAEAARNYRSRRCDARMPLIVWLDNSDPRPNSRAIAQKRQRRKNHRAGSSAGLAEVRPVAGEKVELTLIGRATNIRPRFETRDGEGGSPRCAIRSHRGMNRFAGDGKRDDERVSARLRASSASRNSVALIRRKILVAPRVSRSRTNVATTIPLRARSSINYSTRTSAFRRRQRKTREILGDS